MPTNKVTTTPKKSKKEKLFVLSVVAICVVMIFFVVVIKLALAPTGNPLNSLTTDTASSANSQTLQEMTNDIDEGLKSIDSTYNFKAAGTDESLDAPQFEQELTNVQ